MWCRAERADAVMEGRLAWLTLLPSPSPSPSPSMRTGARTRTKLLLVESSQLSEPCCSTLKMTTSPVKSRKWES